jgi:hypothetical protein
MGLDMYLSKRKYVKNWDFQQPEEKHIVTIRKGGKLVKSPFPVEAVIYEAGYWRKANQIHHWFENNVVCNEGWQGEETYVSEEKLKELLGLCYKVRKVAKIEKGLVQNGSRSTDTGWEPIMEEGELITNPEEVAAILPTASGFFFGSTDYDQYYMFDIYNTITILEKVLEDKTSGEYYYSASW